MTLTDLIEKIYIDQDQCIDFGVEYRSECDFVISSQDLRRSKSYDVAHTNLFDAYPDQIFHLRRKENFAPGWYSWALF